MRSELKKDDLVLGYKASSPLNCGGKLALFGLAERTQAIGANHHFLLDALVVNRVLGNIRHKATIRRPLGKAHGVTVLRPLATDFTALRHLITPFRPE